MKKSDLRKIINEELGLLLEKEKNFYYAMEALIVDDPNQRGQIKQFKAKNFEDGAKQAIDLAKKVRTGTANLGGEVPFIWMTGPDKIIVTHWDDEFEHHLDVQNHFGGYRNIMKQAYKAGAKVGTTGAPKVFKI